MRRIHIPLLLGLACMVAVVGCGRSPSPPPVSPAPPVAAADAPTRADRLRAGLAGLRSVQGRRQWPGRESAYQAYFEGRTLRYLAETVTECSGEFRNHYYFESGGLFYYTGEQAAAADSGATGPAPHVPVVVEWRGTEVARAVRIEHYGEVPLTPAETGAIRRRAAELLSAAQDEQTATGVP